MGKGRPFGPGGLPVWDDPNRTGCPMTKWLVIGYGLLIVGSIIVERLWN